MEKLRTKVLPISDTLREWRYRTHEPALHPYSFWDTAVRSEMGTEMKTAVFAALVLAIGSSAGQAGDLGPSHPADGVRFAAMSLTKDQGVRAIISNVLAPGNSAHLAPCQAQVSFFGADGSLIGNAMMVKLKRFRRSTPRSRHHNPLETRLRRLCQHRRRRRFCQSVRAADER